ncbi:gamma-crystallin S-1-like [Rhinoraja longicauda]
MAAGRTNMRQRPAAALQLLDTTMATEGRVSNLAGLNMGKVIFYEDRNFQGRHYECSTDCADLSPYFSRCNSIRVDSDWWVAYEKPNYMGYQYVLNRGEYPDYQRWMGFNDNIRSCRTYPHVSDNLIFLLQQQGGNYRMKIYERPEFGGQTMEFMDDCPSVYDRFRYRDIHSCQVTDGHWIFYEQPNYRGRQYFMRPGEYRKYNDWGGYNSTIGSFRRMRDF